MAAYNWGEGRVSKAVANQRAQGLPADVNALAAHTGKTVTWSVRRISQTQHVEAIAQHFGTTANAVRAANGIPRESPPDVARRTAISLAELAKWNRITSKRTKQALATGKVLTLWVLRANYTSNCLAVSIANPRGRRVTAVFSLKHLEAG